MATQASESLDKMDPRQDTMLRTVWQLGRQLSGHQTWESEGTDTERSCRHAETCRDMQRHAETCRDMQRHAETCRDMQRHAETCRQKYQTDIRKVRKEMGETVWESCSKDSALYGPLNLFIRNLQGGWLTLLALIQVKDNAAISVSIPKQGLFNEKACWAAPGEEVDTSRLGCWPKDTKIPKNKIRYI